MNTGAWQRFRSDPYGMSGLIVVAIFFAIAMCVWSGFLGQSWSAVTGDAFESASSSHWFGTNMLGQDVLQRTLFGTATAFETGLIVTLSSSLLGTVMGALAGWYRRRWLDEIILWMTGVLDSIPFYLFAAAVAFALQGNPWAMHLAMIVTFWTTTARIIRGEVIRLKKRAFVEAAFVIGLPGMTTVFRHVIRILFTSCWCSRPSFCCRYQYRGNFEFSRAWHTGWGELGFDAGRKLYRGSIRSFCQFSICRDFAFSLANGV